MSSVTLLGSKVLTLTKYVSTTKLGTGIHLKSTCSFVVTFQKVVCCSVIVHKYFTHNSDVNRLSKRCYKVSLKVNEGHATVLRL